MHLRTTSKRFSTYKSSEIQFGDVAGPWRWSTKLFFFELEICIYLSRSCRRRQVQGLRGTGRISASQSGGKCASSCHCCLHTHRRLRSFVRRVKVSRSADARRNIRSCPKYYNKRPDIRHVHCFSSIHSRLQIEFPRDEQEKFISNINPTKKCDNADDNGKTNFHSFTKTRILCCFHGHKLSFFFFYLDE